MSADGFQNPFPCLQNSEYIATGEAVILNVFVVILSGAKDLLEVAGKFRVALAADVLSADGFQKPLTRFFAVILSAAKDLLRLGVL